MKLKIDQVAISPPETMVGEAIKLLTEMGAEEWARDSVKAAGSVFGSTEQVNFADLAFNYNLVSGHEFEVLTYTGGVNWLDVGRRGGSVSHLGMHVTAEELEKWREFFKARNIPVAQEVVTLSHTNPVIAGKRRYQYVIFNTRPILGVDLKFIVRKTLNEMEPDVIVTECLSCSARANRIAAMYHGHEYCSGCQETTNHVIIQG